MPSVFNKWHCFISKGNMVLVLLDHVAVLVLKVAMCDYTLFLLKHFERNTSVAESVHGTNVNCSYL